MTIRALSQLENVAKSDTVGALPLGGGGVGHQPHALMATTTMTADGLATITVTPVVVDITTNTALILPAGCRSNSTGSSSSSSSSQSASSYDDDDGTDDELLLGGNSKDDDNNNNHSRNNIGHQPKSKQDLGE